MFWLGARSEPLRNTFPIALSTTDSANMENTLHACTHVDCAEQFTPMCRWPHSSKLVFLCRTCLAKLSSYRIEIEVCIGGTWFASSMPRIKNCLAGVITESESRMPKASSIRDSGEPPDQCIPPLRTCDRDGCTSTVDEGLTFHINRGPEFRRLCTHCADWLRKVPMLDVAAMPLCEFCSPRDFRPGRHTCIRCKAQYCDDHGGACLSCTSFTPFTGCGSCLIAHSCYHEQ